MGTSIAISATRQNLSTEAPLYTRISIEANKKKTSRHKRRDGNNRELHPRDFVRGRWAVELHEWRRYCIPNGCMVCFLPCVSIAQISARINVDSYGAALLKQLAFNLVVWALVILELVYCFRYVTTIFGGGQERTSTPPIVIFSAVFIVSLVSCVWVQRLAWLRTRVRERFRIDGTEADDKCAMAWCTQCAIAQMATQVQSYRPGSCSFSAPDALPPYIP